MTEQKSETEGRDIIARDYAFTRLQIMDSSDLLGYTLGDVKEISDQFHSAQRRVLEPLSAQRRQEELRQTAEFENILRRVKRRILSLCEDRDEKPTVRTENTVAKLPKITIKSFDGKLENWISFKQLFDSLVHKRDMPNVEKLHYLLSSVQGQAYDLIKNYPLSDASYVNAYDALSKCYDKKRQIASIYYEKLLFCEPVKAKGSADLERIHRSFSENLNILGKYGLPDRNFMLFHLLWSKLDNATKEAFELQTNLDSTIPQFDKLHEFVERRFHALENASPKPVVSAKPANKYKPVLVASKQCCAFCGASHHITNCESFLNLSPLSRFDKVKEKRLCILCLSPSHVARFCKERERCRQCNYSHHDLLHFPKEVKKDTENSHPSALASHSTDRSDVLFSTAIVLVKNKLGQFVPVRALFDCGSACNFITEQCARKLDMNITSSCQSVNGIGLSVTDPKGTVFCEILPSDKNMLYKLSFESLVLPKICPDMPSGLVDMAEMHHLKGLVLADPNLDKPGPIDMLLSVNVFASSLRPGLIQGEPGQPSAIRTVFGWIVMGDCSLLNKNCLVASNHTNKNCFFASSLSLDNTIKKFWELENIDIPKNKILSKEDVQCEAYFEKHSSRNSEGRVIVPLPFVEPQNKPNFVDSRALALKRFSSLEKKFKTNPSFQKAYVGFMEDYIESHHLDEVEPPSSDTGHFYYIPHHGILRPDSVTTPLRVVFDASAKDSEGKSLNDTLLPGPKLQTNIFELLMRFRWHAVVFTGDIKQMYRQFLVPPEDSEYQRIVWRASPDTPIRDYRLLTVTYGVSSAPYQALRSIAKLAEEADSSLPLGATVLRRDIYVDDIVTGAQSIDEACVIRDELVRILSSAGLHLRKWTSNCEDFFRNLKSSDLYSDSFRNFEDINDLSLKILGLLWSPKDDVFSFKTSVVDGRCSKRSVLSEISRIFDPLGLVSPVVFLAKYIMQLLWLSGVDWDEDVPEAIAKEWLAFKSQLSSLSSVVIPRRMINTFVVLQIHGFCDASERGYCAVTYCRVVDSHGVVNVRLCCAKSKVAPLRKKSIPRLELLAAVLLSELIVSVVEALKDFYRVDNIFTWSDSSVALTWIKSCPSKWKTFVANRVTEIQDRVPPDCWRHVATADNPADCGSRGLLPTDLVRAHSWWAGPAWLSEPEDQWPRSSFSFDQVAFDEQKIYSFFTASNANFIDDLLQKFSSLDKLVNVLAYCLRYLNNLTKSRPKWTGKALLCSEMNNSILFLVKHVQERSFSSEIRYLSNNSPDSLPKQLRRFCPFLDKDGLLRVGGRLAHGRMAYETKHPLLLPRDHRLTALIIESYHQKFMHPGLQTLQNLLSQTFWILSPKRAIRSVISGCVKCFRAHPRLAPPPLMGDLPAFRIGQLKPFSSAAVDYAGPFDISLARARGARTYKGYICVFVCTVTKAVHFELVSELTSEAYLAALRRFISRRGRCSRLVSDQGRNFIGASNILRRFEEEAAHVEKINFVFNPPGSPHFSGLAEAGVKSVKTHLTRVVGSQRLTFEEFYTVLTQIEAMLNSRPLSPLSSDPNDFSVLTPGHFLTLEPLTILPEENLVDEKVSPLQRWKLLQKMHQDFWRKWHLEYIHTLQQRRKWTENPDSIQIGTLVLLVNETCSPLKWNLGRVLHLHPGADGITRVVTVRTTSGDYKRPVVKLCPLPTLN